MLRAFSISLVVFATACAGEKPQAPAVSPTTTTSAASNVVPVKDQNAQPIVRNGMRAHSLGGAAPTFAAYLNGMHNRIHPEFADKELNKLDALPAEDPLNDKKLATRVEIILSAEDGHIVKMGVAKTSGVTAFDAAALDSVQRAQPFGPASRAIASADDNVYVDWEFRRDEVFACSTMHSRPFLFGP